MSRGCAALQREFAKLDQLAILDVSVGLCLRVLGNDALARWYLSLDHTRTSHMIRVHVCIDCKHEVDQNVDNSSAFNFKLNVDILSK